MPLFERPPLETLAMARDRWTPIYLEHGRLEVDDSSVKWIGADGLLCRLPVATISAVLLGPGTTVTHAAMKACADSNTPVCWIGEECIRFYAFGLAPNHDNDMPRFHATAWADKKRRAEIARRMFKMRFPDVDVESRSIKELRGMEGLRVRALYAQLGLQYGVTWKGRNYNKDNWEMGGRHQPCAVRGQCQPLRPVRGGGLLARLCAVAGLHSRRRHVAFHLRRGRPLQTPHQHPGGFVVRQNPADDGELVRKLLKQRVEEQKLLPRIPKDLETLFAELPMASAKSEIINRKS